jgi:primase-polymerase (primpol)-like protein
METEVGTDASGSGQGQQFDSNAANCKDDGLSHSCAGSMKEQIDSGQQRPNAIRPEIDGIPEDLRHLRQWVLWSYIRRNGRWTKVPYTPGTTKQAKTNDPATWRSFEDACTFYRVGPAINGQRPDGIGFVFSSEDPFTGVDLDNARDPVTGQIRDWARPLIEMLDTHCEVSPSGTGVKLICRAKLKITRHKQVYGGGQVEVFDDKKYFTLTGVRV